MKMWSSVLAIVAAGLMVTTTVFAQTTAPGDKTPTAPGASGTDAKSDTMKPGSMKSGGTKADALKADKGSKSRGNRAARGGNREQVQAAQQALKDKGHDPGSIDGVMGPKTQKALKDFQKAEGLKDTGRLDAETMAKLGIEAKTGAAGGSSPAASPATGDSPSSTTPSAAPSAPEPSKSKQRSGESMQQSDKSPAASPSQELNKKEKSQ